MANSASISIGNREVGHEHPIFVIAEIGINHDGDINTAMKLVDKAIWAGASAVKFQTYITEKRVSLDSPIFNILKQCELSFSEQKKLFKYASDNGILAFSTPFDRESVQFLSEINVPCYKVASFDLVNAPLLQEISKHERPVILSRGMANMNEIDNAMDILRKGSAQVVLLHCISAYPVTDNTSLNLSTINALEDRYETPVGFSDHTIGTEASQYAVAAGAVAIEKHFTLSSSSKGPDHALSSEPGQLKLLIEKCEVVRSMVGAPAWGPLDAEKETLQYRRVNN